MKVARRKAQISVLLAVVLLLSTFGSAFAQSSANNTNFTTSVTYGNGGTSDANVVFTFYAENQGTPSATENVSLKPNATASLFLGNVDDLSGAFQGSATISANEPIQAVVVQVPQNNPLVVNRPLSNGFSSGGPQSVIATVLKDTFGQTTSFSCQNADTKAVDIKVEFINTSAAVVATENANNVPVGAARFFEAENIGALPAGFNGSARATAVASGTTTPANIVCSVSELGVSGGIKSYKAKAFEGVAQAGNSFFVSSALCNAFGGQSTAYAVTNASSTDSADVTVTYTGGATDTANIGPGAKNSFVACNAPGISDGYSGAATISSVGAPVVAIAKKFINNQVLETAFAGEASGAAKLSLPYIRWAPDAEFKDGTGKYQRAFIAIQNVGGAAANNVQVRFYDVEGKLVGTDTIANIPPGGKANSSPAEMTRAGGIPQNAQIWFGTPTGNQASSGVSGKFGGGAVIEAAGAQLVAIASITSEPASGKVQEDYNAIQ